MRKNKKHYPYFFSDTTQRKIFPTLKNSQATGELFELQKYERERANLNEKPPEKKKKPNLLSVCNSYLFLKRFLMLIQISGR
ncbi:hypothetical protein LEP1GSC108_4959 [Leptospira weilii str. UI 13098]|uniref:Uncharacterized protein n=1 Tax=Leptospira weilii str. UI 13098 TaxID=1088542 RepID=M6QEK8_9LEPT|nr:hypothetical protein LEP1GSC108_4959 [Leptospira weilii str. UI 13098]QDK21699.1 hypothetical protein FHG67_02240 [Leptospira weilii]QDK25639.1 hypothetical protein FHG68_02095 [Leptospira weilii]